MQQDPKDMSTSDLVLEIAHFERTQYNESTTREDWERFHAVKAELDARVPRPL